MVLQQCDNSRPVGGPAVNFMWPVRPCEKMHRKWPVEALTFPIFVSLINSPHCLYLWSSSHILACTFAIFVCQGHVHLKISVSQWAYCALLCSALVSYCCARGEQKMMWFVWCIWWCENDTELKLNTMLWWCSKPTQPPIPSGIGNEYQPRVSGSALTGG